jgi:hypothetical protein
MIFFVTWTWMGFQAADRTMALEEIVAVRADFGRAQGAVER